jgi:TolA-binding protein
MKTSFRFSARVLLLAGVAGLFFVSFAQESVPVSGLATSQLLKQARDLLENRKAAEAVSFLEEVLVRLQEMDDPQSVKARMTARYQLGLCRLEAGQYEQAAADFQQFIVDFPGHESVSEARFLTLDALAWQEDSAPMRAYINELEQSGELERLLPVLGEKNDTTRHAVLSLLSAYARAADYEGFQRFLPFSDEDALSDIGLNLALMDGGDLAVEQGEYLTALQLYRAVRVCSELLAGYDRRLAALQAELKIPLPWVPVAQRDAQLAQRAADTDRLARMTAERADLERKNYDQDLMVRMAQCYDAMERRWNAYVLYNHLYTAFPDSRSAERSRYSAFQCLAALDELPRAKEEAAAYLELYPAGRYRDAVTLGLMQIHLRLSDLTAAETLGQALREQDPIHRYVDQVVYLLGYVQFQLQNYEAALELFRETASAWPDRIYAEESVYWQGMCSLFLGRYAEAAEVFEGYLADTERSPKEFEEDVLYRLGMARYGLEEYETAKEIFQRFPVQFPVSDLCSEAFSMLGDLYGADGELDQALTFYGQARECAVNAEQESYAVFQAAQVYDLLDRHADLVALMQGYLDERGADGDFAKAVLRMCRSMRVLGENEKALDALCDAAVHFGNIPHAEQADLLFTDLLDEVRDPLRGGVSADGLIARLGPARADAAADESRQALALRLTALFAGISDLPNEYSEALLAEENLELFTPLPLRVFAEAAAARGDRVRVQQALDCFLNKYAESSDALVMSNIQIRLLMAAGRMEEALALAQQSLARYPDDPAAAQTHMLAADALRLAGQYERAAEMYSGLLAVRDWRGPLTPQALYWTGVCAREQGLVEQACAWFQRVYVLYQQYPEWTAKAYAASADCLEKLGRHDDVVRTWREMVADPEVVRTPEGRQAEAELEKLKETVR